VSGDFRRQRKRKKHARQGATTARGLASTAAKSAFVLGPTAGGVARIWNKPPPPGSRKSSGDTLRVAEIPPHPPPSKPSITTNPSKREFPPDFTAPLYASHWEWQLRN
jgi:hypothetical protein